MSRALLVALVILLAVVAMRGIRKVAAADARAELATEARLEADARADDAERAVAAVLLQEDGLIAVRTAERDRAIARADSLERDRAAAAERARRAAAAATEAEDRVRATLAADSAGLAAFEGYVAAVELQTSALEERAEAAEERASVLVLGLAAADSVAASAFRQRDAALAANAALRVALNAAVTEADAWRDAAQPSVFGLRIDPGTAYVAGVVTGVVITGGVVTWLLLR